MRNLNHLSEIFNSYDTYVIDLWGVMHNGISLNPKAIEVIENLNKNSKKIVFLSNAPRPSLKVIDFLKKMKMDEKFLSKVVTSGEAAMQAVNQHKFGKKFYHLGPVRDNSIFKKVEENKYDKIFVDLNDDQYCIDLAAKNINSLKRILKSNGTITAQVGSQDKKPKQVDKWLNLFEKSFGNTSLDRIYIPSFDCSWNFASSLNK